MLTRLRAFSERFKRATVRMSSIVAFAAMTLLLLVPNAFGEFVGGIPDMLRYLVVVLMFGFVFLFYPQYRFWQQMRRTAGSSRAASQAQKSIAMPAAAPEVLRDPVQEALEQRKRRVEQAEAKSGETHVFSADPEIKLADWTQDKGGDPDEGDFYAMLSQLSSKDTPQSDAEPSAGSIVEDALKKRQADSNSET